MICGAPAARRSSCSTGAAGRTSSPAAPAGGCGCVPSATSRSCCTAPAVAWPATTAVTPSAVPHRCPDCASVSVARHGAGTERIEHELRDALGDTGFPILRLDADSAGLDARAHTLERFAAARRGRARRHPDGRQGPRFPRCRTRDRARRRQTLRFPDFRAEERTFALVTQLAGRAGRGIRAAACSCRRSRRTPARSRSRRATTPTASSPASSPAARCSATRRSRR